MGYRDQAKNWHILMRGGRLASFRGLHGGNDNPFGRVWLSLKRKDCTSGPPSVEIVGCTRPDTANEVSSGNSRAIRALYDFNTCTSRRQKAGKNSALYDSAYRSADPSDRLGRKESFQPLGFLYHLLEGTRFSIFICIYLDRVNTFYETGLGSHVGIKGWPL